MQKMNDREKRVDRKNKAKERLAKEEELKLKIKEKELAAKSKELEWQQVYGDGRKALVDIEGKVFCVRQTEV